MEARVESAPADIGERMLGVTLMLASTVLFSLSGVLTKLVQADAWTILGWRGAFSGLIVLVYVAISQRRAGRTLDLRLDARGWVVAFVSAVASVFFISSFKLTSVGNVAIIYATVPFMAAAIGFFALGERVASRTLLASGAALAGVMLTVSGSFGSGNLTGDALAVVMTLLCAVYLVMVRAFRDAATVWAGGVGALLLVIPGLLLGDLNSISPRDAVLMTFFAFSFAAAIVLWTEGARRVPPAEAGLLGTAEIPLATLFAWLLIDERQTAMGLAGGAIVVTAVGLHALFDLRRERAKRAAGQAA